MNYIVCLNEEEIRMEDKGLSWEWAEILRGLDNLQEVEQWLRLKHPSRNSLA